VNPLKLRTTAQPSKQQEQTRFKTTHSTMRLEQPETLITDTSTKEHMLKRTPRVFTRRGRAHYTVA
jgi:hypothetical protein